MSGAAQDRIDRLRLIRSPSIGPITYFQLIRRFGSAAAALEAIPALAARGGGAPPRLAPLAEIEREMAAVARLGAHYLFAGQSPYPPLLAQLENAPPALIVRGAPGLLARPAVALVGARNASAAAQRFGRELARDLAGEGLAVVSGLARGIDTAAHQGAGAANTIAIIASGIDIAYPPENAALQEEIATAGLLIAEQPPGREPLARHFPFRNRIIAGMSLGTVVVEAAPKSGSLITARIAAEAGREVMAVPGSPLDPRARGCNELIREGATLVQCAADIVEAIRPIGTGVAEPPAPYRAEPGDAGGIDDPDDAERAAVTGLLGPVAVPVDELVRLSGLPLAAVQLVLLELELAGRLERHAGGRVSLS